PAVPDRGQRRRRPAQHERARAVRARGRGRKRLGGTGRRAVPVRRAGRTTGRVRRRRNRVADGGPDPRAQRGRQCRAANPRADPGPGTVSDMSIVYVGSYGSGISTFARDGARLTLLDRVDTPNPSWLTLSPDGRTLYTVDELDSRSVAAFEVTGSGLKLLSRAPTGGEAPCHLLLHPAGYLLAANYGSGSVSVHVLGDDGVVGPRVDLVRHTGSGADPDRQAGPHAHEVRLAGDLVVVVDLGLDRLIGYRLEPASGALTVAADPFARTHPGAGPRHAVAHPNGRWYVADELDSTISVFDPDVSTGVLHQVAALPASSSTVDGGNYPAGIALSRDATRVYVSNRGRDT